MAGSTFVIGGTTVDPIADDFVALRFGERFGAVPTLTLTKRGVSLPGLSDPWSGKTITWTYNNGTTSTTYFTGDVVQVHPRFDDRHGWVIEYQCLGLRNRLDWFPHTDSATGIDTSAFNLPLTDPAYNAARAGRNVGQILTAVLTMTANAAALNAIGVGNYTGLPSAPALPAVTVSDLAAMTIVPKDPVYFTGEKFGAALDSFMETCAPNYRPWIDRSGNLRFLDLRTFSAHTFTLDTDPIEPSELSRDIAENFQRVVVLGQPIAIMAILKLSNGDITENFAHDGLTNSAAKSAWTPADFQQPGAAQDVGTCTCPSTTTVTITSSDATKTWVAGNYDQSHQQGTINLSSTTISDFTQYWSARIISDPGLAAGGTDTLTIDNPMPSTAYDHYTITGLATGGSVVWTQYQITNTNLWPRVTSQSTHPQPFINAAGGASLISTPLACVLWSSSGSPPYNSFPVGFTFNATTGNIRLNAPSYIIANNQAPADVWVALPVYTNPLQAVEPPDSGGLPTYTGTSNSVEGLQKTLTITAEFWRDPGQLAQVQAYASDLLDSVKDAVVEGQIVYHGLFEAALDFGLAANVTGASYTTGWESANLPILEVELEWLDDAPTEFRTTMHVSNRRAHYSAEMFMSPPRTFLPLGLGDGMESPYGTPSAPSYPGEGGGNPQFGTSNLPEDLDDGGLSAGVPA